MPTDNEWKTLEMYLGMTHSNANDTRYRGTDEGGKMKELGLEHWESPNTGATNESGFIAVPGGFHYCGYFMHIGYFGYWWSSTSISTFDASMRSLGYDESKVYRNNQDKRLGYSVRRVKD